MTKFLNCNRCAKEKKSQESKRWSGMAGKLFRSQKQPSRSSLSHALRLGSLPE
jgi:hypothetical protein